MGLDITAYKTVKFVRPLKPGENSHAEWPRIERLYVNNHFVARADGLKDGLYEVSQEPDGQINFRAGSYSGYNRWRATLAGLVGTTPEAEWEKETPSGPFHELINFADNEGIIGPVTSAKLAKDFAEWRERAEKYGRGIDDGWWWENYQEWQRAFELAASGGGVVKFH